MTVIRSFGIILVLLGGFLIYRVIGSSLPIIFGQKIKATIVAIERVKNKRFTYLYYPIFQFPYHNKIIKVVDKSSDVEKKSLNEQQVIFYHEKYGISRGFSAAMLVFSLISLSFISFGIVALFKKSYPYFVVT